jgi:hypothetical protein
LIYCVVPADLAEELFDRLTAYYAGDPNVAVIVDRRRGERRSRASASDAARRQLRDRRRRGAGMSLPQLDPLA